MAYSLEGEIFDLEKKEIVTSETMRYIINGTENIQGAVSKLLQEFDLNIPVDDVIVSARKNLENPRCCSDG